MLVKRNFIPKAIFCVYSTTKPLLNTPDDMTVLMSAACSQVPEVDGPFLCAKQVREAGADLEALHAKSITALIFAVKLGHLQMVTYFLENGAASVINHKDMNTRSVSR